MSKPGAEGTHTPGPWRTTDCRNQKNGLIRIHSAYHPSFESHVANVRNAINAEANARLIAAAPEMLEALKGCLSSIQSEWGDCEGCKVDPCRQCKAKAAIRKAEGSD